MYLKLNRLIIEIKTQERALISRDVFFKILFVGWGGQKLKARTVGLKPTLIKHMPHADRLNMGGRHRAGFTCRLSRLKPRASKKMGVSSRTIKTFFSLHRYLQWKTEHLRTCIPFFCSYYTDIFSENMTSEDVKTFFFRSSNQYV